MRSKKLHGIFIAFRVAAHIFYMSIVQLLDALLGRLSIPSVDARVQQFAQGVLHITRTRVKTSGVSHIDKSQSYVFMSNHQSVIDIPVLFAAIPNSFRMMFKSQLQRVPIWGRAMEKAGFIPIDRKDRFKAIQQLEVAKQSLKKGVSIWIAPEGTRSRTLELGPFKKGGFHTAISLHIPIVPVWIEGAAKVVKPDSIVVHSGLTVSVRIGKPIDTVGYDKSNLTKLMERVRHEMLELSHDR